MEEITLYTLLVYITIVFFLLISFFIIIKSLNVKNKVLLAAEKREVEFQKELNYVQLKSIEEDREKIGSTIHDDLGQVITLLWMQIQSLKKINKNVGLQDNDFSKMENLIQNASEKCSNISSMLYPATLLRHGFVDGLHELILEIRYSTELSIDFNCPKLKFTKEISSNLFRIFQELLNNTIKHAKAKNVNIKIILNDASIRFDYSDDGIGTDLVNQKQGLGTNTIKTRIHVMNGRIVETKNKLKGFNLSFILPYGKN
jgi:two-component system, NarL family, sensor kinase